MKGYIVLTFLTFSAFISMCTAKTSNLQQNSVSNTTQPLSAAYNNSCMACIIANYTYCPLTNYCVPYNSNCTAIDNSTIQYSNTTGCPVISNCKDFGLQGIAYLGETGGDRGSYKVNDSASILAPHNNTCAIAFFNYKNLDLDVTITGYGVKSFISKLTLPFNKTALALTNNTFRIQPKDQVTMLYLGSTTSKDQYSAIVWQKRPTSTIKSGSTMKSQAFTQLYTSCQFIILLLSSVYLAY